MQLLQFVTFVHLLFSVQSLDHFCCFAYEHFMFCKKEEFQVQLSHKIVLLQIFIGHRSAWFAPLSACRPIEFNTSVVCHVFMYC